MAEDSNVSQIVLSEIDRQWGQARQSEDQRATLSNFIVVISVAAQGFIVDKGFPKRAMVVAVCLTILGVFGAVAVAKYYERFRLSMTRVGRLREQLDELYPEVKLDETEQRADKKHAGRYPWLSRLRLNLLWRAMMLGIAVLGAFDIWMIHRWGQ